MAQVRVSFEGPQSFGGITVTGMTVEADQLVLLQGGAPVLNVAADMVRSVEGRRGGRLASLRERYPNHGKPWTAQEDAELGRRFADGVSLTELGEHFGRSRGAVRSALLRLGFPDRAAGSDAL